MKSLKNLAVVTEALAKIQTNALINHDNGTFGMKVKCHYYSVDKIKDKKRSDLETEITKKLLLGQDASELKAKLDELPPAKGIMTFKLVEPMSYLKGTKVVTFNGKNISPEVRNLEYIHIPQDILENDAVIGYEDVDGEVGQDIQGRDVQVIELNLAKCMMDVKEGRRDNYGKFSIAPKVYVTEISFRSMQIAGKMLSYAKMEQYKAWNMMSDEEFQAATK